ncbi:MAG: glycerol-3-phosphate dehydrogenase, partial [Clostridia bacterium]|nr:glycerol-3-phosphate dehydrogenase [Clostridia bacterium]
LFGAGEEALYVGAGDLFVTIFGGRTRRLGTLLGEGYGIGEALAALDGVTLESAAISERMYSVLKALVSDGRADADDYPLLLHICGVLHKDNGLDIPWNEFIN